MLYFLKTIFNKNLNSRLQSLVYIIIWLEQFENILCASFVAINIWISCLRFQNIPNISYYKDWGVG